MRNRKIIAIVCIIFGFIVFIGIAIFMKLFSGAELPVQISGALLEAAVTAVLTYVLLSGQTSQEEIKERNVKVFETKSEKFNGFIEELWRVWEDRTVSLEELNNLLKLVSKDIIPYAKPASSSAILAELNKIADKANPDTTDNSATTTKQIQASVFSIINTLSNEIGLGGQIDDGIGNELHSLENKILPYLNKKNCLKTIEELVEKKSLGTLSNLQFSENVLWWRVNGNSAGGMRFVGNAGVWLRVGDVYDKGTPVHISYWSDFYTNRQYKDYRYAQKGEWKDWLKNEEKIEDLLNFNDLRSGNVISDEKLEKLADKIVKFYNENEIDGKTIDEIIEECNKR